MVPAAGEGGGRLGREASDWAREGRGRGQGCHAAGHSHPPSSAGVGGGEGVSGVLSPPILHGLPLRNATSSPPEKHLTWLSTYYVSDLRWHFSLPSHSVLASATGHEATPLHGWGNRGSERDGLVQGHTATKQVTATRIRVWGSCETACFGLTRRLPSIPVPCMDGFFIFCFLGSVKFYMYQRPILIVLKHLRICLRKAPVPTEK